MSWNRSRRNEIKYLKKKKNQLSGSAHRPAYQVSLGKKKMEFFFKRKDFWAATDRALGTREKTRGKESIALIARYLRSCLLRARCCCDLRSSLRARCCCNAHNLSIYSRWLDSRDSCVCGSIQGFLREIIQQKLCNLFYCFEFSDVANDCFLAS
jgi:hypothetical protein